MKNFIGGIIIVLFCMLLEFISITVTISIIFLAICFVTWLILGIDLIDILSTLLSHLE